jgi:hypothetical protein
VRAPAALQVANAQPAPLRRPACALSYLNDNQLSGSIPPSLGSLMVLKLLCVRSTVLQ